MLRCNINSHQEPSRFIKSREPQGFFSSFPSLLLYAFLHQATQGSKATNVLLHAKNVDTTLTGLQRLADTSPQVSSESSCSCNGFTTSPSKIVQERPGNHVNIPNVSKCIERFRKSSCKKLINHSTTCRSNYTRDEMRKNCCLCNLFLHSFLDLQLG